MVDRAVKLVGAVIAGGRSTRFGGDKAAAVVGGKALIDHVIEAMSVQTDALLIVGRAWRQFSWVDDRPFRCGPLSGLCAALHWAEVHGFSHVLSSGCDVLPVPPDLSARLAGDGPAVARGQRLLGLWPSSLAAQLETHIMTQDDHSLRQWVETSGARSITFASTMHNLNQPADLERFAAGE